jgi:uncharacterized membrane protein YfcA
MMEIPLTISKSLLACGVVMIGSILQGSVGIGLGFAAVPLLVLLDPLFIPGPLLIAALLLTLLITYREHGSIEFSGIHWAIIGRVIGTVLGAILLTIIPQTKLSLLFGIIVLLAVAISFIGIRISLSPYSLFGTGTISGFMGTTSAIGGAPMALIYQNLKGPNLRGTLSSIFVIGTSISIISLIYIGRLGLPEVKRALVLFPGIMAGFAISKHTAKILDRGYIRPTVLILAASSGFLIIIKNIL